MNDAAEMAIQTAKMFVCPLCPLHCDDVRVGPDGWSAAGCPIVDRFEPTPDRGEWPSDFPDDLPGDFFSAGPRPLRVMTASADLVTARRLVEMVQRGEIVLTIESDPSTTAFLEMVSRDGIISATLADIANHADRLILVGRVEETWPRILHHLHQTSGRNPIERSTEVTLDRYPVWSADELAKMASRGDHALSGSRYTAVLLGPDAFAPGEEPIAAAMLGRIIRNVNRTSRAVVLTLDAAATLRSVFLWQTNTAPENVGPTVCTETSAILAPGSIHPETVDVRLGSPASDRSRPARLQIGGRDPGPELAGAYRRAATAGIDFASMVIRGDSSVTLPLASPLGEPLPRSFEILRAVTKTSSNELTT